MKQQALVMHGGTSFDTHEDYIAFLKTRDLSVAKLTQTADWKAEMGRDLGEAFEVLVPKMPNATNARYDEWRIWLERCAAFFRDDIILVGQSLGGIFLAKYLSEETLPVKIKATLLVAAPFDDTSTVESLKDFALPASLKKLAAQGGAIYILHSHDDPVVPFAQTAKFEAALPQAQILVFNDRGHFNQGRFPELVELIKSL